MKNSRDIPGPRRSLLMSVKKLRKSQKSERQAEVQVKEGHEIGQSLSMIDRSRAAKKFKVRLEIAEKIDEEQK